MSSFNDVPDKDADLKDWRIARLTYTDAELYRLFVAHQLLCGYADNKDEVDREIRALGDVETANELIAFRSKRPGCIAYYHNPERCHCPCGVSWRKDDPNPPACRKEALR